MNKTITKLRKLAKVLLIASVAACVYGLFMIFISIHELNIISAEGAGRAEYAPAVTELAEGIVLAVHYFFVSKFFIHSLKHGVPFTHEGSREIRILGYETIFLPILVFIISVIDYGGVRHAFVVSGMSIYEMVLGIALILVSYAVEYGTKIIEAGQRGHQALRYIMEHYPKAASEAKAALWGEGVDFPDKEVFTARLVKKNGK